MALGALRTRLALAKAKGLVPRRLGADSGPGSKQQLEKVRPRAPTPPSLSPFPAPATRGPRRANGHGLSFSSCCSR